ncbi:ATP-binding protein [Roseibium sediminis]|uniref:ATP-binding protein n=1 Tax=Roseibium sediminis TaxID=1775174 RepID=UPI00137577BF|nr:ATP-binding protein [Roseibium sediminis]
MTKVETPTATPTILEVVTLFHEMAPHYDDIGSALSQICALFGSRQGAIIEVEHCSKSHGFEYSVMAISGFGSKKEAEEQLIVGLPANYDEGMSSVSPDIKPLIKGDELLGFMYLEGAKHAQWKDLKPILTGLTLGFHQRASDRKHLEELEVLQDAFEATAEGYVVYDPDDRLHFCNTAYKELYSHSRAVMTPGTKFEDILRYGLLRGQYAEAGQNPEEQEAWLKARLMLHKKPMHSVTQRLGNGSWLKINERRTSRGYTVGVRTDVTEFKDTEDALRRSEAESKRLALVASKTKNHVNILDAASKIEWVNDAFMDTTGYTCEEVMGQTFGEFMIGPGSDTGTLSYFRHCMENGQSCREVIHSYKKDGTPFWNLIEIQPIFGDDGKIANYIVIGQDVTKEKTSELAIKRSEMKFRSLVNLAPVGILQTSRDGRFVDCNETFARLSFLTKQELARTDFGNIFSAFSDEDRQYYLEDVETHGHVGPVEVEFVSGSDRHYAIINSLLVDIPGGMPIIWTILQDITEQKRIEKLKSEFIAVVSHELRTPITAMIGSLGIITSGAFGPLGDKQKPLLEMAQKNAVRLKSMVDNILDSEKLEAGQLAVDIAEVDLVKIAQDTVVEFRSYCADRNIDINLQTELPTAIAYADSMRVSQIMLNLLSNAAKYSPENSEVTVSVSQIDDNYSIAITDRGTGIPEEALDRLFERFYQVDSTDKRAKQGTGLGLSICQALADAHGSRIDVASEVGKGSTFSFKLSAA